MKINKTKLLEAFKNLKDIPNIKILSFYKVLFSKYGIKKNIGFFLNLEYDIAIKYDKRTYLEYYFSLLKT